jgi:hypothetical protein
MWTPPGPAISGEVNRRITELRNRGSTWARLCLQAFNDSHPAVIANNPTYYKDMFDTQGYLLNENYTADIKSIIDHAGNEGFSLLVCPWESPHVPRGGLGDGLPTGNSTDWWESFIEMTRGCKHIAYDLSNEPEDNFNGGDDDRRAGIFLDLVEVIRDKEAEVGSVQHDITLPGLGAWARTVDAWAGRLPADTNDIWIKGHVYDSFNGPSDTAYQRLTNAKAAYPKVLVGEFGPVSGFMTPDDCNRLVDFCRANNIPASAWAYAHRDSIPMLIEDSGSAGIGQNLNALTDWGQQFMGFLANN